MPGTPELPAAKRSLLEKYLRGELSETSRESVTGRVSANGASSASSGSRSPVATVQAEGSKCPIFYLHVHWQGGAFYCFTIARDLGSDQPFYVLDPYRFDDLPAPPTIEEMAADYIDSLRSVQPQGPYLLAAFCGASLLAYEMAQQLRAQGQAVDLLAFIDPMAGPIQSLKLTGAFIRRTGAWLRLGPDKQLDHFLRLRYVSRVLRRRRDEYTKHSDALMRRWREEHPERFALLPAAGALRQDWLAVFVWAVSGYEPRPYPGKVTYLFAKDNPDGRKLWWGKVKEADNVEIRTIPGTHETCRTEHIHDLADELRMCLGAAQPQQRP
jgi:thioesterase domain-containing protein